MRRTMKEKDLHIDDLQPDTVEEHFELIKTDRSVSSTEYVKVTLDDLPEWFDEKLFKIGQKCYLQNLLGFVVANATGLLAILSVPTIMEVLVFTKKSATVPLSFRRYMETILLMYELYRSDVLKTDSKWFKALNVVRRKHAVSCKKHLRAGHEGIYQKDMAITQFGFIGYFMTCPEKVGLAHCTYEERTGFNHFWRVTAHLLGISDRINICRKTVDETEQLCGLIARDILKAHLENPLPESEELIAYAIEGLWYADPTLNADAIVSLMNDMTGAKYKKSLGWYAYLNMKIREWNFYLYSAPYIGVVVRRFYNYLVTILFWSIENYPLIGRIAFGKQISNICPYANID